MSFPVSKVAACHIAPVWLDTAATIEKAIRWIREASKNGAELICFPETFVPCYPVWTQFKSPVDNGALFQKLCEQSIYFDGPEIAAIQKVCFELKVLVCLGFNERSRASVGCIWNSYVLINDEGHILTHHKKLMPTFFEKLIWSHGDGHGLEVCDTKIGRIGSLICGENTNPLAKYSLIAQGEQIHISLCPPFFLTKRPEEGIDDGFAHATMIRAACQAFEGKTFTIVCSNFFDEEAKDFCKKDDPLNASAYDLVGQSTTCFIGPDGKSIGDSLKNDEGIAYCTFDLNRSVPCKQFQDVAGYYQRYDVFKLTVDRTPSIPVTFIE